jgi:hypothetical protein
MRRGLYGAVAGILGAAFGVTGVLARDPYANIHTVAVVPELDRELLVQNLGFTHFDYESYGLPVGAGASDHAVAAVKAALKAHFAISIDSPPPELFAPNLFGSLNPQQLARIAALSASEGVDAYIVIYPVECRLNMGSLTLIHQKGAPAGYGTTLCTGVRIVVLDARSGKTIDSGTSSSPAACNDSIVATHPGDLNATQKQQLIASTDNVMDKTLAIAMNSAGLIADSEAQKLDADARRVSASLPCQWW